MEGDQIVLLERDGKIAILSLINRARRNAFTPDMRRLLTRHLIELARDDTVRAIVLQGEGEHFCAGADLSRVDPAASPPSINATRENMKEVHGLVRAIAAGPKPIVAAVEGIAAGGGLSIALACDHVVAAENARLITAFAKLGLVGDLGIMWSLCQRVGPRLAKRLLMAPTEIAGLDAVGFGLVDDVVPPGETRKTALDVAARLAESAPLTVALTKAVFAEGITGLEPLLQRELDLIPLVTQSDEFKQAIMSFGRK